MEKSTILAALTFVTLCSGLAVAAHQLWITEKAKKEGTGGPMLNRPSGTTAGKSSASAASAGTASTSQVPTEPNASTEQQPT